MSVNGRSFPRNGLLMDCYLPKRGSRRTLRFASQQEQQDHRFVLLGGHAGIFAPMVAPLAPPMAEPPAVASPSAPRPHDRWCFRNQSSLSLPNSYLQDCVYQFRPQSPNSKNSNLCKKFATILVSAKTRKSARCAQRGSFLCTLWLALKYNARIW